MCPPIELADLDMPNELPLLRVREDFGCFKVWNWGPGGFDIFGVPELVPGRSFATLSALERAPKFGLPKPGVGESAPMRDPIAEPDRGVLGGSKLGRGFCSAGVVPLRMGLSDRPGRDGRPLGVFIALPNERPATDSERLRAGVMEGGASEEVGDDMSRVGVGGGWDESVEFRLLARERGTKMPDNGWAVVK